MHQACGVLLSATGSTGASEAQGTGTRSGPRARGKLASGGDSWEESAGRSSQKPCCRQEGDQETSPDLVGLRNPGQLIRVNSRQMGVDGRSGGPEGPLGPEHEQTCLLCKKLALCPGSDGNQAREG